MFWMVIELVPILLGVAAVRYELAYDYTRDLVEVDFGRLIITLGVYFWVLILAAAANFAHAGLALGTLWSSSLARGLTPPPHQPRMADAPARCAKTRSGRSSRSSCCSLWTAR